MDIPDGTTDGSKNYAGGYFDGYVYQFSKDWKDPVALFPTGLYLGGITYDSTNGTLWVLDSRDEAGGVVRNYQKNGTLVSEFSVVVRPGEQAMGLALDPADQKLWLSRHNTGNPFGSPFVLESYSKTGEPIDRITLNKLSGYQAVGMEFRVPVKMK
jgi:DNA-binding beta-propeller fold protein YncE